MSKVALDSLPKEMNPASVAERIIAVREFHSLRKADMADAISVDRSAWTKIENGERALTLEMAYRIKKRYGPSFEFLFLGEFKSMEPELTSYLWQRLESSSSQANSKSVA